ncbi:MAG TPA: TIGR04282 family arsenosugar biosynthesis glycosyltransferase [Gemmataceae bacterium]
MPPNRPAPEDPRRALGVFAKRPDPGRVKTRLAERTSPEWAAAVARAFLLDTLDRAAGARARRFVVFDPPDAGPFFAGLAAGRFRPVPQGEGDLGERMARFCDGRFAEGAARVVLVGTDSPSLPTEWVEQAFAELDRADVVLGPATDGGYYLLGLSRPAPIFRGMAWSRPDVLLRTVQRLPPPEWRVRLLPPWYDIDTWEDWEMFRGHLAGLERAGDPVYLPHTNCLPPPPPSDRAL